MQLNSVMAKNVITVEAQTSIADAARKMRNSNIGCLVVAHDGAAQGVITDRDVAIRCSAQGHDASTCTVGQHMSRPVVTIGPETDVLDAARIMTERQLKRLPVAEGDRLVGLVSLSDIAEALDRPLHDLMAGFGSARRAPVGDLAGAAAQEMREATEAATIRLS